MASTRHNTSCSEVKINLSGASRAEITFKKRIMGDKVSAIQPRLIEQCRAGVGIKRCKRKVQKFKYTGAFTALVI